MAVARERAARPREPRSGTPSPRAAGVPGASSLFGRQHARSPLCPAEQGTATPRGRTAGPRGSAGPGEYGTCQPGAGGSVPERSQGRGRPPPRPPQRRAQGQRTGSRSRGASCSPPRPLLGSGQDPLVLSDLPQMRPPCGPVQPVRPGTLCPGGQGPGVTPQTARRGGAELAPLPSGHPDTQLCRGPHWHCPFRSCQQLSLPDPFAHGSAPGLLVGRRPWGELMQPH